jgi:hypothetical protein
VALDNKEEAVTEGLDTVLPVAVIVIGTDTGVGSLLVDI